MIMAENPFSVNNNSVPLPEWQKQLIDQRLQSPARLKPIADLFNVLDTED
jgi:hypothetical protein